MIAATAKFQFYWTRKKKSKIPQEQLNKCQSNKWGTCFPKAFWCINCKIIYSSTTTTLSSFGGKTPTTQINQKATFQHVNFYNLSKTKCPSINRKLTCMNQLENVLFFLLNVPVSLFSTFNITFQPSEANRDRSTFKAECICL